MARKLVPNIVESLSALRDYLVAQGNRLRYSKKTVNRAKGTVVKCKEMVDEIEVIKLCDEIESYVAGFEKQLPPQQVSQ
jgi:hypothetical protein